MDCAKRLSGIGLSCGSGYRRGRRSSVSRLSRRVLPRMASSRVNPIGSVGRSDARGSARPPLQSTPGTAVAHSAYLPDSPGIVSPVSGAVGVWLPFQSRCSPCLVSRPLRLDVEISCSRLELKQVNEPKMRPLSLTARFVLVPMVIDGLRITAGPRGCLLRFDTFLPS